MEKNSRTALTEWKNFLWVKFLRRFSKETGAKIKRAATMPAWILWRKHWSLYPNGKIDEGYMERKDSAGREGLAEFFAQ